MNKLHIVVIILILAILIGAMIMLRKPHSTDIAGLTYEELCKKNGDQWMEMEPTVNNKKVSSDTCFGCMIADSHFCTSDEYIQYIKNLPFG